VRRLGYKEIGVYYTKQPHRTPATDEKSRHLLTGFKKGQDGCLWAEVGWGSGTDQTRLRTQPTPELTFTENGANLLIKAEIYGSQ